MNIKIVIDVLLVFLFLTSMSFRVFGGIYHEITGVIIFIVFIIHNLINIKWYKNLKKGSYTWQRKAVLCINLLLILFAFVLILTGILHSKELFHLASEDDTSLMGSWKVHTLAAYWSFMLVSIHFGIYWSTILNKIYPDKSPKGIALLRISGLLVAIYGITQFMKRNIGSKLILYYSFDFWHTSEPLYSYMISYLSIMVTVSFISYYIIRFKKQKLKLINRNL